MKARNDVVIVGAGPIGLAYAWGIKKLNPNLNVLVLEKYETYQRTHTLDMQPQQLKKLMDATRKEGDVDEHELTILLARLRQNSHIRTSELQEIFQRLAEKMNVEIKVNEEVNAENIQEKLCVEGQPPRLIIGADGTHSVVSDRLFPEGNQVKHEFDYVLQLRFEIAGEAKPAPVSSLNFLQGMLIHGLIANEYVGSFEVEKGTTPVTMQMMISKESFQQLENPAKSKNPINFGDQYKMEILPSKEASFINNYLTQRLAKLNLTKENIVIDSVRISVNEAPATHAKQIYTTYTPIVTVVNNNNVEVAEQATVALVGDAALGLSYFKGLNAGLESAAKMLTEMQATIENGLGSVDETNAALERFQAWFKHDFAPKKVEEVSKYSTWNINAIWNAAKAASAVKQMSYYDPAESANGNAILNDYIELFGTKDPDNLRGNLSVNPHRKYELVDHPLQFKFISPLYTLSKIAKIFVDFFKPYKSVQQAKQDFKQPLLGLGNFLVGFIKMFAIFGGQFKHAGDGFLRMVRGLVEIATSPLVLIKPIFRGIARAIKGPAKIENNAGIKRIAKQGLDLLASHNRAEAFSPVEIYTLMAVTKDIHRKFSQNGVRLQRTDIALDEMVNFNRVRSSGCNITAEVLRNYFTLFAGNAAREESQPVVAMQPISLG